ATHATTATIALAWSPKWHASVDGRSVPLEPSADQLLTLALPAGTHRLALDFRPDAWDRLGVAVSALTLALCGAWAVRRRHQAPLVLAAEGAAIATPSAART